jgi:hypothetical protein
MIMAGFLPEPDKNYGMKFFWFPGKPEFFLQIHPRIMPFTLHFP